FLESLHQLVSIDREWIPGDEGTSLYLRPFMYASEVFLGVKPSAEYLYVVIASPTSSYFKGGVKPIALWISDDYTRAAPGGTRAARVSAASCSTSSVAAPKTSTAGSSASSTPRVGRTPTPAKRRGPRPRVAPLPCPRSARRWRRPAPRSAWPTAGGRRATGGRR